MKRSDYEFFDRELSWLSFNYRVLQEAKDPRVPLYERMKFLAIYSSNLDEFFRVRVASLRSLLNLKKKTRKKLGFDPEDLLEEIKSVVHRQQEEFGLIFRNQIICELREHGIALLTERQLTPEQEAGACDYFRQQVEPLLTPVFLSTGKSPPFLANRSLYFVVRLVPKLRDPDADPDAEDETEVRHAVVEIPTQRGAPHKKLPRFVTLPGDGTTRTIMFLDDVMRLCLPQLFPNHDVHGIDAIKLTRDAELYIEDEFSGNLLEKIRLGLQRRDLGVASRFLYDSETPRSLLKLLRKTFSLSKNDFVPGGRYHNFNDLFSFPDFGDASLRDVPLPPLRHRALDAHPTMRAAIRARPVALYYPYHQFDYVCRFLEEAARDPSVTSMRITLYRVAHDSRVIRALVDAAHAGKAVTAFVEVKARFDEEPNLHWSEELERAGARVLYSLPGLKVHAKLCLVTRTLDGRSEQQLYLATGNLNEQTARIYADIGFFTADETLAKDAHAVFAYLEGTAREIATEKLVVAPFELRDTFHKLIDNEIRHARRGETAFMILKMNSLEDRDMIECLYDASNAGVKISLIVRGICCLVPGVTGMSENIKVISIVDRFLEHARVYIFHNGGDERVFVASADLMTRNLKRRIEVMFPISDPTICQELRHMLQLQLHDSVKARIVDPLQRNRYRQSRTGTQASSQVATYTWLREATAPDPTADA